MKRLLLMLAVLGAAVYVGCKQQDGDRCQVNDDCASGRCNMAKGVCSEGSGNESVDAEVPDGTDATLDAPPDAPPDAPDAPET
ncbi:MAG TPA: hypothetical protein VFS15_22290 [Kofleriaceae bacterium]|nr:hypothetical protein [Kofleriaceae bacterium]